MDNLRRFLKLVGGVSFGLVLLTTFVVAPVIVLSIVLEGIGGQTATSQPLIAQIQGVGLPGILGAAGALLVALFLHRWHYL